MPEGEPLAVALTAGYRLAFTAAVGSSALAFTLAATLLRSARTRRGGPLA